MSKDQVTKNCKKTRRVLTCIKKQKDKQDNNKQFLQYQGTVELHI